MRRLVWVFESNPKDIGFGVVVTLRDRLRDVPVVGLVFWTWAFGLEFHRTKATEVEL